MTPTNTKIASIEELATFGLTMFLQIFNLFHSKSLPTSAASNITSMLSATPGITAEHTQVINSAMQAAVNATNTNS